MKLEAPCTTCIGTSRRGLLWLGGSDYLECPDCGGTGVMQMIAERFTPVERLVSMVGIGSLVERRYHPSIAHLQDAYECRSIA